MTTTHRRKNERSLATLTRFESFLYELIPHLFEKRVFALTLSIFLMGLMKRRLPCKKEGGTKEGGQQSQQAQSAQLFGA